MSAIRSYYKYNVHYFKNLQGNLWFFSYIELSIDRVKAAKIEGFTITMKLYPLDILCPTGVIALG